MQLWYALGGLCYHSDCMQAPMMFQHGLLQSMCQLIAAAAMMCLITRVCLVFVCTTYYHIFLSAHLVGPVLPTLTSIATSYGRIPSLSVVTHW